VSSQATPGAISELLDAAGVPYRHLIHIPTRTSQESAAARGEPLEHGAKAIVAKCDGEFRLLVVSAAKKLHTASARASLGVRDIRFASLEELKELTGLEPGGVPPFGRPVLPLNLYVDEGITRLERVAFNAASLTESIIMSAKDYLAAAKPKEIVRLASPD